MALPELPEHVIKEGSWSGSGAARTVDMHMSLLPTRRSSVFLAIVVDVGGDCIFGHRLLDLNAEYGLTPHGARS
jgi:hypothetical protein